MKQHVRKILFVVLLAILPAGGCDTSAPQDAAVSYEVNKEFYKGPLRVQVSLDKDDMSLSGLLNLRLTAQTDPDNEVTFPDLPKSLKAFKIRTDPPQTRKLADNGKLTIEQVFELEPLETGNCDIPALTFTFGKPGAMDELTTEPIAVAVTSSLPQDAPLQIADIEDIVELPPARWPLWTGLGAIPVVIIAAVMYLLRPKKLAPIKHVYRSAHDIALEMLHALASEKLIEQGRVSEFYFKLSGCLRQYIENRFALRAPEQTTEEFLAQLSNSDALAPDHKTQLRRFLQHCDLVKFARYQPTHEQIKESLTMAEQFVENTKSPEHVIDVTDAAQKQEVA